MANNGGLVPPGTEAKAFNRLVYLVSESVKPQWEDLNTDVLKAIFEYLPLKELMACQRLNKRSASIIDATHLRARCFWKNFPLTLPHTFYAAFKEYPAFHKALCFSEPTHKDFKDLNSIENHQSYHKILFYELAKHKTLAQWSLKERYSEVFSRDVLCAFFSRNGKYMVSTTVDDTVGISSCTEAGGWKKEALLEIPPRCDNFIGVTGASFTPDCTQVLVQSPPDNCLLKHQDGDRWLVHQQLDLSGTTHISPCGQNLFSIRGGTAKVMVKNQGGLWETVQEIEHTEWKKNSGESIKLALCRNGQQMATFTAENLRLYNKSADGLWECVYLYNAMTDVNHAVFSPTGKYLALGAFGRGRGRGRVTILIRSGAQSDQPWIDSHSMQHTRELNALFFSPDSSHLIMCSTPCVMYLARNNFSGQCNITATDQEGNEAPVYASGGAFSPDGLQLILINSNVATILVCKPDGNWRQVYNLTQRQTINSVEFGPSGMQVITASRDKSVRIYDVVLGESTNSP
ncbi:F-box protein [Parendozoicomonas haliclonae]|uniref:WD domain, G-beta repeat n=2 Tax=Parendozoicomonas haliclonae TaxID=1960125 RepID=A0A1X7AEX1_9GAMM|nr:WD domain, G-beta repeat [Parendozoicomonas haliclonae]